MKKKLILKTFKIAKISSPKTIIGGTNAGGPIDINETNNCELYSNFYCATFECDSYDCPTAGPITTKPNCGTGSLFPLGN